MKIKGTLKTKVNTRRKSQSMSPTLDLGFFYMHTVHIFWKNWFICREYIQKEEEFHGTGWRKIKQMIKCPRKVSLNSFMGHCGYPGNGNHLSIFFSSQVPSMYSVEDLKVKKGIKWEKVNSQPSLQHVTKQILPLILGYRSPPFLSKPCCFPVLTFRRSYIF